MATYTVVKGDCLWTIAKNKLGSGTRWTELADLNGISRSNPTIYVGQVINLDVSGSSSSTTTNVSSKAIIEFFGLQAGTDTTVFAVWTWDRSNTENYETKWEYDTGNSVWFIGTKSTVEDKQDVYSAPANAKKVRFRVKPVSKKKKVNDTETSYWTAEWSTIKSYDFSNNPPSKPNTPNVEIKDYKLTASLDNLDLNATHIQFQVVKNNSTVYKTGTAKIVTGSAKYSCAVDAGGEYKVRCRSQRGSIYSDWSDYSDNNETKPTASSGITVIKAKSETSVYLEWGKVSTAETYEIEYTTKKEYFDGSDQVQSITGITGTHYEKTGLESGQEYLFRVRAVNSIGSSAWSGIKSIIIGTAPSSPTTWSSTTTGVTGDPLTLYWTHNSEDGSTQTYAEVELYIGTTKETYTINSTAEEDDEKTMSYSVNTSGFVEGTKIQWRVRTAGVTKKYGEWSVQRTVDIYAPPTLSIEVTDLNGNQLEALESFPFYIKGTAGPSTQTPIGYHVSITANESYETTDNLGNFKMVKTGEAVYSKNFDTSSQLLLELSANSVNLDNNIGYTIKCTVTMNSGLKADASDTFVVAWEDLYFSPNAEIGVDEDTLSAYIRPFCEDETGTLVEGVTLAVYRREFDGEFTEIASGLDNTSNTYVTDPHPALDFARYRIVATTTATGAVSFYDVPGYPVGGTAIVIQWDDEWTNFDATSEDALVNPPWSGSMLKLPYNIDVADNYAPDYSLVEYVGRKYPVGYYGTQIGQTSTWNTVIVAEDKETLYALRRLATWMGNVYVREPSGTGYWANVTVGFVQKHRDLTIPISLNITRVAGGV